ncbi:MAG TPA: alpha/beta fold hydrolase [Pseudomonadales bacterium]|nr:alpha/beta fold hydrolase [Pseudomonadales bacterium]
MSHDVPPLLQHFDVNGACLHIFWIPALGTPARFYRHMAQALIDNNVAVSVMELRGHGESTSIPGRHCDFGIDDLLDDARRSLAAIMANFPDRQVIVGGHSLGGHLAMLLAAVMSEPKRVLVVAHGMPYWRFYRGWLRTKILLLAAMINVLTPLLGYFPGHRIGFAGRESRQLMRDWCRWALRGQYDAHYTQPLASFKGQFLAVDIDGDQITPTYVACKTESYLPSAKHSRTQLSLPHNAVNHHHAWAKPAHVDKVVSAMLALLESEQ